MEIFLQAYINREQIKIFPITSAVLITYLHGMTIPPHRDQQYARTGEFYQKQNSQIRDTVTAVLVVGDDRRLDFQLFKQTKKQEVVKSVAPQYFNLTHGSLFILDPCDEVPVVRNCYKDYGPTFYKHSCNGVTDQNAVSLGIVFCATHHLTEVKSDSGIVVLNDKLELGTEGIQGGDNRKKDKKEIARKREIQRARDVVLDNYVEDEIQKKKDDDRIKNAWEKCSNKYFRL